MTGAVPRLLTSVPSNDAPEMRTYRRTDMCLAVVVPIHSEFRRSFAHNRTVTERDVIDGFHFAGFQPFHILAGHVDIFASKLARSRQGKASWVIQFRPWVFSSTDEITEEHAGNRSVRHAHSRIARHDIDILFPRISPDKGESINGFHNLAGPLVVDGFRNGKP